MAIKLMFGKYFVLRWYWYTNFLLDIDKNCRPTINEEKYKKQVQYYTTLGSAQRHI